MISEDILFDPKPCHDCPYNCVEGQVGFKCPYDKMAEDLRFAEEYEYIQSYNNQEQLDNR